MNSYEFEKQKKLIHQVEKLHRALWDLFNEETGRPYPPLLYPTCGDFESKKQDLKELLKAILK